MPIKQGGNKKLKRSARNKAKKKDKVYPGDVEQLRTEQARKAHEERRAARKSKG